MNKNNERICILGGGPSGLSIGFNLTAQQKDVVILEKENKCGGMAGTEVRDGFHLDLGPHIIHTSHQDILSFFKKILGDDLVRRTVKIQIYFNHKFVNYPLKGIKVLTVLPPAKAFLATLSFLLARLKMFIRTPKKETSFKEWITNRFGKVLYGIYFGPYAEKAWKIPASEISAYVAKKRVPVLSLRDYVRRLFHRKPKSFHSEDPSCVEVFYPRKGVGQIADFFEKEIRSQGGQIWTDSHIIEVKMAEDRITAIVVERDGQRKELPISFLFSTIPITNFVRLISPAPPPQVLEAAERLDYCSERLLYILVNKPHVFEASLLYFQNSAIRFNRVYGVSKLGPECVPPGKEALIVEFTCSLGDDIWNASDESLFNEAMMVFESTGALKRSEVDSYFSKQVPYAYPRFRVGFGSQLKTLFEYFQGIRNLTVLGRQGLFCYANVDEVVAMGFRALEIYPSIEWKPIDYAHLFKEFLVIEP